MNKHCTTLISAACGLLLLASSLGCGTEEYEKRLDATVSRARQAQGDQTVYPWTTGEVDMGMGIMVQLPVVVATEPMAQDVDERRRTLSWLPPTVKPVSVHEGVVADSDGGQFHFQCFLALADNDPTIDIQNQLRNAFPGGVSAWEVVACPADDETTSDWQKIDASGAAGDVYYINAEDKADFQSVPCKVSVYVREMNQRFVVIVWRLPESIEGSIGANNDFGLKLWAERTAGGVTAQ